jgi:hypothetical protein
MPIMNGPTIRTDLMEAERQREATLRSKAHITGIRRAPSASNGWQAIVNGKLAGEWFGLGSKSKAVRAAGTNQEIS